jgi:hypothetical protein
MGKIPFIYFFFYRPNYSFSVKTPFIKVIDLGLTDSAKVVWHFSHFSTILHEFPKFTGFELGRGGVILQGGP